MSETVGLRSSFHDELLVFYRHRFWIVWPVVLCLTLVTIYNFLARPVFRTDSVVSIEAVSRVPGIRAYADIPTTEAAVARQIALLVSPEIAEATTTAVSSPQARAEMSTGTLRTGFGVVEGAYESLIHPQAGVPTKTDLIAALRSRIQVTRLPGTNWLSIQCSTYEPQAGAEILNELVDQYFDEVQRSNTAMIQGEKALLSQKLDTQKATVGQTLGALSERSQETQGGNPAYQRPMMQRQLSALQEQYASVSARRVTLAAQLATSPDGAELELTDSPRAQALRSKLDGIRSELASKETTLGERHPEVVSLLSQEQLLKESLHAESKAERERLESELRGLARQQSALGDALEKSINKASNVAVSSFEAAVLMREADAGERVLTETIERSQRGGDVAVFEPRVVQRADARMQPVFPQVRGNYLGALAIGLLAGVALAKFRASVDDTIRTTDDIKALGFDAPLLGVVPIESQIATQGLVSFLTRSTPIAEAYRVVRTNLPPHVSVIAVSSARPGDGKSTTSAALAVLLGQTAERVLLIDGDMRRPSLSRLLRVEPATGLSDALKTMSLAPHVIQVDGIDFLSAGQPDPQGAARLADGGFTRLMEQARKQYRFIVVDTPPALALADASAMARDVDGLVLVAASGQTQKGALAVTVEQLQRQGLRVFGFVLNQMDFRDISDAYGRYYAAYDKYYSVAPRSISEPSVKEALVETGVRPSSGTSAKAGGPQSS